jgi:hypothetical protein
MTAESANGKSKTRSGTSPVVHDRVLKSPTDRSGVTSITVNLPCCVHPGGMPTNPPPDLFCKRLKEIGYARSNIVKLYGEELRLLSDPYPEGKDFVIEVRSQRTLTARVVRIPKFIVSSTRAA